MNGADAFTRSSGFIDFENIAHGARIGSKFYPLFRHEVALSCRVSERRRIPLSRSSRPMRIGVGVPKSSLSHSKRMVGER